MSLNDRFENLAEKWSEHCNRIMFSSIITDYLDHPAYREIVQLGPPAIPLIIERYRQDQLPWGFILQDITGVQIIKDKHDFNPAEAKKQWLEWWKEQKQQHAAQSYSPTNGSPTPAKSN